MIFKQPFVILYPFLTNVPFLTPLKKSENPWFSDFLKNYRVENGRENTAKYTEISTNFLRGNFVETHNFRRVSGKWRFHKISAPWA